ncbi:MAG: DegT/DnrJ/EryC1/StrS family aminotransferase [Clostridia bacterium]|nr:DegT/DnrJ/EryC1/StrS family aminotransferase [Clostridia bacterium]MBR5743122.1 DegT/DnrJ/EryC1/StrS family aminotransferase [Clostridia bacterium]
MFRVGEEEIRAFAESLLSRDFFKINNAGREVYRFEEEWKKETGASYALTMTSGFAALTSALIGMGIGPGDEVIVPGYTYIASALAVLAVGAIPVIAEIDGTMTLDAADAEKKISGATKAIMPVHIQGFPSDLDGIRAVAARHGVFVLEDACQADGGSYKDRRLGTVGDAGAFSFNFFKLITAGEGGAMVTDNRTIYERALIYHDAGAVAFFGDQLKDIREPLFGGSEFRVSDLTGAILRAQLKRMPGILRDLRRNRDALWERIEGAGSFLRAPSHDAAGDCGTTLALRFETKEDCRAFVSACAEKGLSLTVPIDTGKHVYTNWTQIMEKRGAFHPAMDPYKMEANRGLQSDYAPDMCPATLDYLQRTAYVGISPDWDEKKIEELASILKGE